MYFMAPREGGACDFPNRDNNMIRYYFVSAESRSLIWQLSTMSNLT